MMNVESAGRFNGMPAAELGEVVWRKSRRSNSTGNCVEFAALGNQLIAIRDSKDPDGPALVFTRAEIVMWLEDLKAGEADGLLSEGAEGFGVLDRTPVRAVAGVN